MITIKTAAAETKPVSAVYVKGANGPKQVSGAYQVCMENGAKTARLLYKLNTGPEVPVILRIYEEDTGLGYYNIIVEIEENSNDSLEYKFTWSEASIVSNDEWQTSNSHEVPPCVTEVQISVRGVKDGVCSAAVSQIYHTEHETYHNSLGYVSNGPSGGSYGTHSVYCTDCGEYLHDEECTADDMGVCIYCGESVM